MKKISKKLLLLISVVFLFLITLVAYNQKNNSNLIKIGFVTDWEYQEKTTTKNRTSDLAKYFLSKTVVYYNRIFKPDLVIGGGDYIGGQANLDNLQDVVSIFNKIKAEKLFCLGKKDYQSENQKEVFNILNLEKTYFTKTIKGLKIIILDSTQNNQKDSTQGTINAEQLVWLEKELAQKEPVIIFSHHSLIETPTEDVWRQNLTNQSKIKDLIKKNHSRIIAIISGNARNDYITKEIGIPFLNISGLTNEKNLGRFSDLKIEKDSKNENVFTIKLKNHGKNQSSYSIKRDLNTKTATRIKLEKIELDLENQRWFNVGDSKNLDGVLSSGVSGEPNLNLTENNNPVVAFENKEQSGKIQVKIFKNNQWTVLADQDHPQGLISFGSASNPNIETKGEDIFIVFTEKDFDNKVRLVHWSDKDKNWNELSFQGFLSEKISHEPALLFDKNKENLYVVFAEIISANNDQTQAKIKKWDGNSWTDLKFDNSTLISQTSSSVDEFDLALSESNNLIYLTYEEITPSQQHFVRVKSWDGNSFKDLNLDKLYIEKISKNEGYSPSVTIDNKGNLFLAFVGKDQENVYVYKNNTKYWESLGYQLEDSSKKAIEPFIETDTKSNLYLAYSEYKHNIVMALNNGKNTGEELIKTSAWRVKVKKMTEAGWVDCEDDLNYSGYISKGSGKGDPAMKASENSLFIVFSDEENGYSARVKKFQIN